MHPVILYQCKTHVALQTLGLFSFSAACVDASFFIMIVVHSYIMFTHSISTPSQSQHCGRHRSRAARAGQIRGSPLKSIYRHGARHFEAWQEKLYFSVCFSRGADGHQEFWGDTAAHL